MNGDLNLEDELLAAGTTCPLPDCDALIVAYRPAIGTEPVPNSLWEFRCPRCGVEFTRNDDLLFQSIPEQWLLAGIHSSNLAPGKISFNRIYTGENHDEICFGIASSAKETG
jgi:hypothetical protein